MKIESKWKHKFVAKYTIVVDVKEGISDILQALIKCKFALHPD